MINPPTRLVLERIARRVMKERGLEPDFSPAALAEAEALTIEPPTPGAGVRDLRGLLWCSIDNEETRDLDQLTVAEALPKGAVRMRIAIADVSAFVAQRSAIDAHAAQNTTSVYTIARVFPMLPERLSTDLTSMNLGEDRRATVIEIVFAAGGAVEDVDVYEAVVHNHARLNYDDVAGWLDDSGRAPAALTAVPGLGENLQLQLRVAREIRALRFTRGALSFETARGARPVFVGAELRDIGEERTNRAKRMIEDFMIAANGATAAFLTKQRYASLRRVVRTPKRWDRIVELAAARGAKLPAEPDPKALENFLRTAKQRRPRDFPDLSLAVIKLLGAGEYALEIPGQPSTGHFGLAVRDYAHSTAPNRRFPDLVTQRLLKAAMAGRPSPYPNAELEVLAAHCTEQEDDARKVERQVAKSAAAMLLESRIGEEFDALITGSAPKGTWVRLFRPAVEGKLERGFKRRDVGDHVRVRLIGVDVERGFIDFEAVR